MERSVRFLAQAMGWMAAAAPCARRVECEEGMGGWCAAVGRRRGVANGAALPQVGSEANVETDADTAVGAMPDGKAGASRS